MQKRTVVGLIVVAGFVVAVLGFGLYSWRAYKLAHQQGDTRDGLTGQHYLTREDAEAALRRNPDDMVAHRGLGMQFYVKTDKPKAIHHLREAIRIAKRRDPNDAVAPYVLAQLLMETGQRAEGMTLLKSLAGLNNPVGRNARKTLEKYQGPPGADTKTR